MNKIEVDSGKMEMLGRELGKLQCWLTGYHAGKGHTSNMLGAGIPGENAVRQAKLLFRDMVQAAKAPAVESAEAPVADADGWLVHDGKGMPVLHTQLVSAKFRGGDLLEEYDAGDWHSNDPKESCWIHDGGETDIISYKIINT